MHLSGCSSHFFNEMVLADEASQIQFIDRYLAEKLAIDYWWMDAGWYVNASGWPNTGTWEVDTQAFSARSAGHHRPRARAGAADDRVV